jgi:hypothetical protein
MSDTVSSSAETIGRPHLLISQSTINHINNLNISNIEQADADASVTQGGRCTDALVSPNITDAAVESAISSAAVSAVDETLRHLPPDSVAGIGPFDHDGIRGFACGR